MMMTMMMMLMMMMIMMMGMWISSSCNGRAIGV